MKIDEDSGDDRNLPELKMLADERGCELIPPQPDQLLIDIDQPIDSGLDQMNQRIYELIDREYGVRKKEKWASINGRAHYRLTLWRDINDTERLFLQAVLGSDPVREFFGWRRMTNEHECPSVLFRPNKKED